MQKQRIYSISKSPPNKSAKIRYSRDVVTGWKGGLEEEMIESDVLMGEAVAMAGGRGDMI